LITVEAVPVIPGYAGVPDACAGRKFDGKPVIKSKAINVSENTLAKPLPDLPMGVELWGDSFIFSCI
jgi:hypothetical protein